MVKERKELVLRGVYQADTNSLVEKFGQTNLREEMACFLGGTGSKMSRRWNRNTSDYRNKSRLGIFNQVQTPYRLHCPLDRVILFYLV
jgi:hypothetical protein